MGPRRRAFHPSDATGVGRAPNGCQGCQQLRDRRATEARPEDSAQLRQSPVSQARPDQPRDKSPPTWSRATMRRAVQAADLAPVENETSVDVSMNERPLSLPASLREIWRRRVLGDSRRGALRTWRGCLTDFSSPTNSTAVALVLLPPSAASTSGAPANDPHTDAVIANSTPVLTAAGAKVSPPVGVAKLRTLVTVTGDQWTDPPSPGPGATGRLRRTAGQCGRLELCHLHRSAGDGLGGISGGRVAAAIRPAHQAGQ